MNGGANDLGEGFPAVNMGALFSRAPASAVPLEAVGGGAAVA